MRTIINIGVDTTTIRNAPPTPNTQNHHICSNPGSSVSNVNMSYYVKMLLHSSSTTFPTRFNILLPNIFSKPVA